MQSAARGHLARIIQGERRRSLRRLAIMRVAIGVTALGITVGDGLGRGDPGARGAILPALIYLAVTLVLAVLPRVLPKAQGSGISTALVDVPLLTAMLYSGLQTVDRRFIVDGFGCYCMLIVLSALSLSTVAVISTCIASLLGGAMLYAIIGAPFEEQLLVALPSVFTAVFCVILVSRVQALVGEARRDDLLGKYILGERLGAGGMAEVFRATYAPEGGFEREVAVKRVLPAYAADAKFVERFRREAELTARLVHPNIVQVLDFGLHHDTYFIAMELVEGVSLRHLLKPPLAPSAVVYVATELAQALDFIHSRTAPDGSSLGLVHRDLNPPNVLVSRHGEVKVADFGVARATQGSNLTASGMLVGKVSYLSPEQLGGGDYDGRADLFALGLTLYELLTGRRVVQGLSDAIALKELSAASFAPPSQVRPEVPVALDAIIMGLLERDPAHRPSAAMLLGQLASLSESVADLQEGRRLLAAAVVAAMPQATAYPGPRRSGPTDGPPPLAETRTTTIAPPPVA